MTAAGQENRIRDAGSRAPAGATASEGDDSLNGKATTEPERESIAVATSGPEATSSRGIDHEPPVFESTPVYGLGAAGFPFLPRPGSLET